MAYSWLLSDAVIDADRHMASKGGLLEDLIVCGRRLRDCDNNHDVADVLAANLAYDRALMGLANATGIATSPRRFGNSDERHRLEERLAALGSAWRALICQAHTKPQTNRFR